MKVSTLLLSLLFFSASVAGAQTVTPTVVASAGGSGTAGDVTISWTVGELAVTTLQSGELTVTQGFHQPPLGTTSVAESARLHLDLSTHPNPATSYLSVQLPVAASSGTFILIDILGRTVLSTVPASGTKEMNLDLNGLAEGTYVARYLAGETTWSTVVTVRR